MRRTATLLPITAATTALVASVGLFGYLALADADTTPKAPQSTVYRTTDPTFGCPEGFVYPAQAC
jgi:hypothetical protein